MLEYALAVIVFPKVVTRIAAGLDPKLMSEVGVLIVPPTEEISRSQ